MLNEECLTRKIVLTAFMSMWLITGSAQVPTVNPFFFGRPDQTSDVTPVNLGSIGKHYVDNNWNAGNIFLSNGDSLIGYYMRYDLFRNHLETIIGTKIQAINGSYITSFEWFSTDRLRPEVFVNKSQTSLADDKEIPGFLELLVDGNAKLYKCQLVIAPQQLTSPSLLPETSKKVHMIEKYYYELQGVAYELENGNKRNLSNIESPELAKFVVNENLKFKVESDLIKIINEYNNMSHN